MRLMHPHWLWFLAALAFPAALAWWAAQRRERRARLLAEDTTRGKLAPRPTGLRRFGAGALPLAAAALLLLALARPQSGSRKRQVEREGAAVAVVLDASLSMATEDVAPSRYLLARRAIESLLARLGGDRVALVVFSGQAVLLSPLTSDYRVIPLLLEGIGPGLVGKPGSALAAGIVGGIEALSGVADGSGRALIVFSDGEDWGGGLQNAVESLEKAGIAPLVLGIGKPQGEPIPIRDVEGNVLSYKTDAQGEVVVSKLGESTLQKLADDSGGRYWRLSSSLMELTNVHDEIEALARERFEEQDLYRYTERFAWAAFPALILLWFELLWPWAPRARRARIPARGVQLTAAVCLWLLGSGFDWQTYRDTQKGVAAYSREEYDAARKRFVGALEDAPESASESAALHFNLGNAYFKEGRLDDARAEWERAGKLSDDPTLKSRVEYNLGNAAAAESAGQDKPDPEALRRALEHYRNALEIAPQDETAKHNFEVASRLMELIPPPPPQQQKGQGEREDSKEQQRAQAQAAQSREQQDDEGDRQPESAAQVKPDESQQQDSVADRTEQQEQQRRQPESSQSTRTGGTEEEQEEGDSASASSGGEQEEGEPRDPRDISREEAERLLDALNEKERQQRHEQQARLQGSRGSHDW